MKAVRREDAPVAIEGDGLEFRRQEIGGNLTVAFVHVPEGADLRPALAGLPEDLCQCPHWGYLIKGRVKMHTPDGTTSMRKAKRSTGLRATLPRRSRTPTTSISHPLGNSTR